MDLNELFHSESQDSQCLYKEGSTNMLLVTDKDRIEYDISHLKDDKLETLEDVVHRYESSDMKLFYHVVGSPSCRYEARFGKNRIPSAIMKMSAEERFLNILKEKRICGNPKSFFVNKNSEALTPTNFHDIKSVSFTLASIDELQEHFKARDSEYAICFFHDFLQDKGLRRVEYLNDHLNEDIQR